MRTIVFLGTNKSGSSREAIKAAEQMGFFTVLLTDNDRFMEQRVLFPDVHQMIRISLEDEEQIREQLDLLAEQGKRVDLIASFLETHVTTAARLSREFCETTISVEAMEKMQDKVLTRAALKDSQHSIAYWCWETSQSARDFAETIAEEHGFPVIVKSPRSTGSKDVLKAESEDDLRRFLRKLGEKYPDETVLVEEYLDGPQVLVEAVVMEGEVQIVALVEQEIDKQERFIVTGYAVHPEVPEEWRESLQEAVRDIVRTLRMTTGACHLEMRRVQDDWRLVEINPRISGGAMNKMIEAATGINLVQETMKLYLGWSPDLRPLWQKPMFTQYLTVPNKGILVRVTGRNKASRIPGVEEVFVKPMKGTRLTTPLSMGHRYAYVMATGSTMEEAKETAKLAASKIMFHLHP